jgi:ceramide glucosyltransferase
MPTLHPLAEVVGVTSLAIAAGYSLLTLLAVSFWRLRRKPQAPPVLPAVTILKPLCGAEPGLYENLRSFCEQDYPEFQVVFGVRDRNDPALAVARRLTAEFPQLSIDIVIDPQQHGTNRKVSSLINMLAMARHDVIAMVDSDARVGPDYLRAVSAPLSDKEVGMVTCPYHGEPTEPVWSRLGAMYVNEWYMPSVLMAWLFGHHCYVSGQTMCLRRDTLAALGGLETLANHLADDYRLGELVRGLGLRIALSSYSPEAEHHEPTLDLLLRHELRWMRTLRVLRPKSYRYLFFSFSLPLALLGLALCAPESTLAAPRVLFEVTLLARLGLHILHRLNGTRPLLADLWLLPARDLLICWIWCRSFSASRVSWRGNEFDVDARGIMHRSS